MKLITILLLLMVLISGCESGHGYYAKMLDTCHNNNPDELNYCQCWASCEAGYKSAGTNCHLNCDILLNLYQSK